MPRFTSVTQMMAELPQHFSAEVAGSMNSTMQLDISGDGGGQWHVIVADGKVEVHEGVAATPQMTLGVAATDYLALVNGEANPMQLFMQGKIKIKGDMQLAMKLQSLFKA